MTYRYALLALSFLYLASMNAQQPQLELLNHKRSVLDAHNCYPYDGQWADRIDRALRAGFPVAIEQDLAWYVDPTSGNGRVVVCHSAKPSGAEPTLRDYFFERLRPIVKKELASGDRSRWPLIVLHFDFKDNQQALLTAVWRLLSEYEPWITIAVKGSDAHTVAPLDIKPLLVITEDSDAQQEVFFDTVPVGSHLRVFGSAHTNLPAARTEAERDHLAATSPPEQLLNERPTNYRRWWNNSWHEVEDGGQQHAGAWTAPDAARLRALVDHAHDLGYWIRFYTLDGFDPAVGHQNGWFREYNFGSLSAVQQRWRAAIDAGVDFIATDQYGELGEFIHSREAKGH